jgi:hypothetical protein
LTKLPLFIEFEKLAKLKLVLVQWRPHVITDNVIIWLMLWGIWGRSLKPKIAEENKADSWGRRKKDQKRFKKLIFFFFQKIFPSKIKAFPIFLHCSAADYCCRP